MRTQRLPLRVLLIGLFATLLGLGGAACGSSGRKKPVASPPPAPEPATPQQVQAIRQAYAQSYPNSRIGVVVAARPQDRLVAVGEVAYQDLRENDTVIFIDSSQKTIADGVIVRLLPEVGHVHVKYTPTAGGRAPRPGDIMVKL
jgi:hypothetical protein